MTRVLSFSLLASLLCISCGAEDKHRPTSYRFEATAYSIEGTTKSGLEAQHGLIAADPRWLPIGTEVQISGAGRYSGRYLVADTGREIKGQEVDIYLPDDAAAKRFGRKQIHLRVLKWGDGQSLR